MILLRLLKYGFIFFAGFGSATILFMLLAGKRLSKVALFFTVCIIFGVAVFVDAFWIEPNWIAVDRVVIRDARLADAVKGLKIVHITDIHMNDGIRFRERELQTKINALQPDIVLITGDFFDDLTQVEPMIELLKGIKAKVGIWAVPGNTDKIFMTAEKLRATLSRGGVTVLLNEAVRLQSPTGYFWIAGLDQHFTSYDREVGLRQALRYVPPYEPSILLAHSPKIFGYAVNYGVDLVLTGHIHGGQVGIPLLVQLSKYANRTPYVHGLFKSGKTYLYSNRGIGMKTIPVRFLCRPEIAVLEVRE